jgi:hypothetical protein
MALFMGYESGEMRSAYLRPLCFLGSASCTSILQAAPGGVLKLRGCSSDVEHHDDEYGREGWRKIPFLSIFYQSHSVKDGNSLKKAVQFFLLKTASTQVFEHVWLCGWAMAHAHEVAGKGACK